MTSRKYFQISLLKWNTEENTRLMPWKGEKDPYKIWISEIILQQTRVEQGLEYYNRFISKYPSVVHLATAEEKEIYKSWEGLGYYSRCKNMILTARRICKEFEERFPNTYADILSLKGVGEYTASAIASFAFGLPHAVLDGNVFRLLSRYFGIETSTNTSEGKKIFATLADELLDKKDPGAYNQSIMDYGATVCKPKPLCTVCVIKSKCRAYVEGTISLLPVKGKPLIRTTRWMYFFRINYKDQVYVQKRSSKDIWENLYQFVLLEAKSKISDAQLTSGEVIRKLLGKTSYRVSSISPEKVQLLTHQTIKGCFVTISIDHPMLIKGYHRIPESELSGLAFPKFITSSM